MAGMSYSPSEHDIPAILPKNGRNVVVLHQQMMGCDIPAILLRNGWNVALSISIGVKLTVHTTFGVL
jgi:hypothetical protein